MLTSPATAIHQSAHRHEVDLTVLDLGHLLLDYAGPVGDILLMQTRSRAPDADGLTEGDLRRLCHLAECFGPRRQSAPPHARVFRISPSVVRRRWAAHDDQAREQRLTQVIGCDVGHDVRPVLHAPIGAIVVDRMRKGGVQLGTVSGGQVYTAAPGLNRRGKARGTSSGRRVVQGRSGP